MSEIANDTIWTLPERWQKHPCTRTINNIQWDIQWHQLTHESHQKQNSFSLCHVYVYPRYLCVFWFLESTAKILGKQRADLLGGLEGAYHTGEPHFFFFFLQMLIEEHSPNTVFICLVAFGDGRGREEEVRSFQNQSVNQKQGSMAKLPGSSWFLRNAKPFLLFPVHPVLCTVPLAQLRSWNHPPSSHFQKEKRQMFCSKDSQRCHPPRPPEKEDHRTRGSAWDFRASAVRDTQPPSGPAQAAPQILAVGKSNILPTWF